MLPVTTRELRSLTSWASSVDGSVVTAMTTDPPLGTVAAALGAASTAPSNQGGCEGGPGSTGTVS